MKKLITLLMFSLIGITQTWAWGDIYLYAEGHWSDDDNSYKMTCASTNNYYYIIPIANITSSEKGFNFRFHAHGDNSYSEEVCPYTNDAWITSTDYVGTRCINSVTHGNRAFLVPKNPNAKYACINISWRNDGSGDAWHITSTILDEETSVVYVNNTSFATVYAFAWDGYINQLGAWPGTIMTQNTDGTYSLENVAIGTNSKIIFNDGSDTGKSGELSFVANSLYNHSGQVNNQSVGVGSTYAISTYSSEYPLDFSEVDDIQAYVVTGVDGEGTLTTVKVSKDGETAGKKVPAKTGLLITAAAVSTSVDVPTTVSTDDIGTNWLKPGTGTTVNQTESDGSTNYVLTANTVNGTKEVKFYKVNGTSGNTVPTDKAYLQIPPSSPAPQFFNFDFDFSTPTGINKVQNSGFMANGLVYNLNGQRVAQPTKGLYIVNGRKVVIK